MCYDQRTSLIAFIVAWAVSLYLIKRNRGYDKWNAAMIMTFSMIQLLEFGVWGAIDTNDIKLNRILTMMILVALTVQPLVQTINMPSTTTSVEKPLLVLVYSGILLYAITRVLSTPTSSIYSTVGPNHHLVWNAPDGLFGNTLLSILYLLGLFVPLLYQGSKGIPIIAVALATLLFSIYNTSSGEYGSMWCISAVSLSFVALFIN